MIRRAFWPAFLLFAVSAWAEFPAGEYTGTFVNSDQSRDGKLRSVFARNSDATWDCKFFFSIGGNEIATKTISCVVDGSKFKAEYNAEVDGTAIRTKITGEAMDDKSMQGTFQAFDAAGEDLVDQGKWKASLRP